MTLRSIAFFFTLVCTAMANLNPQIDEFFRLTGLDQMFRVYTTVDEAVAGVSS